MRTLLLIPAILIAAISNAATIYVAANGNDNAAGTYFAPWKTLDKVNQMMPTFMAGDVIFFRRGDVFAGRLKINRSGLLNVPIIFSTYGSGDKPVINGFTALTGWQTVGLNLWETSTVLTGAYLNMLTINGVVQDKGRYPNATAPDRGYLYFEGFTHTASTIDTYSGTLTDNELDGAINWTGADIRVRKRAWVLDKGLITNQSGKVLSYTTQEGPDGPGEANFGYFIQNDLRTLDADGEWYYNPVTKKLRMYHTVNPNSLSIQAAAYDTLLSFGASSFIKVENLCFKGSDSVGIALENSSHITISNCSIDYSGRDGVSGNGNTYTVFVYNSIRHSNNNGMNFAIQAVDDAVVYDAHNTIQFDTVEYSGTLPGLGANNNSNSTGMFVAGSNTLIEGNVVRLSGYNGIQFLGDNVILLHNVVDSFCLVKQDGAGIGTFGAFNTVNKKVTGNIVGNGIGAIEGTSTKMATSANGYYWDDLSAGIDMRFNTAYNCNGNGLFAHNNDHITVVGNWFYNNLYGILLGGDELALLTGHKMRNMVVTDNFIITPLWHQVGLNVSTVYNDYNLIGEVNNNHYFTVSANDIKAHEAHYSIPGANAAYGFERTATTEKFINRPYVITSEGAKMAIATDNLIIDGTTAYPVLNIGILAYGKQYRIRFQAKGVNNSRNMQVALQRYGNNDYSIISKPILFPVDTLNTDTEIIFTPWWNEPSTVLTFAANPPASGLAFPIKVTGLQIQEVTAGFASISDSVRFEVNPTAFPKIITLNGSYIDETGRKYSTVMVLAPYTATFLQRTGGAQEIL